MVRGRRWELDIASQRVPWGQELDQKQEGDRRKDAHPEDQVTAASVWRMTSE